MPEHFDAAITPYDTPQRASYLSDLEYAATIIALMRRFRHIEATPYAAVAAAAARFYYAPFRCH